jgi:hypothetical protein
LVAVATSGQSQSLAYAAIFDCSLRFRAKVGTKPMQGYVTILNEPLELHCHHENISDLRKARRMDWTTTHLGDFSVWCPVQSQLVQTCNWVPNGSETVTGGSSKIALQTIRVPQALPIQRNAQDKKR